MDDTAFSLAHYVAEVHRWVVDAFGVRVAEDRRERRQRFLEEALETYQAAGGKLTEADRLVTYVFNRPSGVLQQEVGGVLSTLAALCATYEVDMAQAATSELARMWSDIDKIRAKQKGKP
jgi:hypothetical protein